MPRSRKQTCLACLEQFPCGRQRRHKRICHPCINKFLVVKMDESQVQPRNLICPCCSKQFTDGQLRSNLSGPQYRRLRALQSVTSGLNANSGVCYNCKFVNDQNPGVRDIVCDNCPTVTCLCCKGPWHEGQCWDWNPVQVGPIADARHCPCCGIVIEKSAGCNHMHCRWCEYEFAWCCGESWHNCQGHRVAQVQRPILTSVCILAVGFFGVWIYALKHYIEAS